MSLQIQKGETFTDVAPGKSVTSTRLNAHVDSAILLPGCITEQTDLSTAIATDDTLLVHDLSTSLLKKVQAANLLPPQVISAKTDISTAIATDDVLLVSDTSDSGALKKVQAANLIALEAITSKTDLSTAIATDDVLLISDTSASGALKKVQAANLIALEAITGKSALTATATDDLVLVSDTSASGALKKVALTNLTPFFTVASVALGAGSLYDAVHSLGEMPKFVRWVLVMGATTENGYTAGDEVDAASFSLSDNNDAAFTWGASAANVWLKAASTISTTIWGLSKSGVEANFTISRWTAKCYASL